MAYEIASSADPSCSHQAEALAVIGPISSGDRLTSSERSVSRNKWWYRYRSR